MNHSFKDNNDGICRECGFNAVSHTALAQCESCPNMGECNVIDEILMCATCEARDIEIKRELGLNKPTNERESRIVELINRLAKEIPSDRRAYFVGRITAIVDIEHELRAAQSENPNFELARIVEANIARLRTNITGLHQSVREAQGEIVADQKYLNILVPQLREEEREKFKQYDINYKPSEVSIPSSSASKPRQSASDKAMESYAKMLGISVEQARIAMSNAIKTTTGAKCSCAETPGICKVHA